MDQTTEFLDSIKKDFQTIEKDENYQETEQFFKDNERELKKERNIPESDDCKIVKGFQNYQTEGDKLLISEDEHFWGYKDLIETNFRITIIPEWECAPSI